MVVPRRISNTRNVFCEKKKKKNILWSHFHIKVFKSLSILNKTLNSLFDTIHKNIYSLPKKSKKWNK